MNWQERAEKAEAALAQQALAAITKADEDDALAQQAEPVIRRTDERFVSDFNSEYAAPPADEARELAEARVAIADALEALERNRSVNINALAGALIRIDAYLAKVKR